MAHGTDVLGKGRQQRAQRGHRQRMGFEVGAQLRDRRRVVALAAQRAIECVEGRETRGRRRVAFVGEIVGVAREAIDGGHRRAQLRGHEQRGDREVFVVVDRGDQGP